LIKFLENTTITPTNVKEILDLNVSNILQTGLVDSRVRHLLELLKITLLCRYFPDDSRYKKNYQKVLKRRPQQEVARQEPSKDASESSAEIEIRKRTLIKL